MKLTSTKKPKKAKPAASYAPHDAIALVIDTAERSGWALYDAGALVNWGEVDMLRPVRSTDRWGHSGWDADRVCLHALAECTFSKPRPAVLVYERPFRGTTQGQYIGAWKAAWVANQGRVRAMVGVYPATWRARVLGSPSLPREEGRRAEMRVALEQAGVKALGGDEAAAIAMGRWAIRAGEVGKVLPKRAPKRLAETG